MECFRPLWNCLQTFCNCLNCSEDLGIQGQDERTLLLDPGLSRSPAMRQSNSEINNDFAQSLPKKDDQNANALCVLVQNTAINMIDVGAMDAQNLEHQEYSDRIKLYSQRLQQQWSKVQHPRSESGFLTDVHNPDYYLTKSHIAEDVALIGNVLNKVQFALANLKIDHKEAIVVPFRIP